MKAPGEERFVQRRAEQRSGATVFGPRRCEPAHCKAWRLCWAKSRKDRNQQHRSLHGNLQVVVANVTALSNLRLALASKPDVALLCEVRASRSQLLAEAKKFGYTAAVGGDGFCLAAVLFLPGKGQGLPLHCKGEWADRSAAAVIDLGNGYACCMAVVYGHDGPTISQKQELSGVLEHILFELRALGRGPCVIAGDWNVAPGDLAVHEVLGRAGWVDWSAEPTCKTANSHQARRIDQCWLSQDMQARVEGVAVDWYSGLCTHALQRGTFREGEPAAFTAWQVRDKGPSKEEQPFTDLEFWSALNSRWLPWVEAVATEDVDTMWSLLESTVCECHSLRSPGFLAPAPGMVQKHEEPRRELHGGDLQEASLTAAVLRKRRWQQLLAWHDKADSAERVRHTAGLRKALQGDADPEWAAAAMLQLPRVGLVALVARAREEEDLVRDKLRKHRREGFRTWCKAGTEGSMKALFRWVREGPRSLQSMGLHLKEGRFFAGQAALLHASEEAWWPLWQQTQGPCWARVAPPRRLPGWRTRDFEAEELQRVVFGMSCSKAPGHDGWTVARMRQWPLAVWSCIVRLFKLVEKLGRWPAALRGGVICLLPKAGAQATTATPMEARPVVLLPMLYRLWAYKRGREVGQWLESHGLQGLPDMTMSAEAYGTLLAAELERATFEDEPVLAACTDLSKAYDTVDLELLAFVLAGSGMPEAVWRPMLDMAAAPRCIKVLQAVGAWRQPTSGMLPGCPAATFIISLLLERWRRGTKAASLTAQVRCWVDDSTAVGKGRSGGLAVLVAAVRHMEDLEQGDGFRVNRKKSGVVVSHGCLQKLAEEAAAYRRAAQFGMVLGFGEVQPEDWEQQWRGFLGAPSSTVFRWRSSRPPSAEQRVRAKECAAAARQAGALAASLAQAAKEAAAAAKAAAESLEQAGGTDGSRTESLVTAEGLVVRANAAAAVAAAEAEAALSQELEASAAVVDVLALAAATTVWLAFDGLPPEEEAAEVLSANRGVWLAATGFQREHFVRAAAALILDSDPLKWQRSPPLELPVVPALKDLGVAQGAGRHGKELQAKRAKVAFDRLSLVGRLGVPRAKLGLLAANSALTAGLFGGAAHAYDADFLPTLRRWVMHATYRGSRFAQVRLFMHLVLPCKAADPVRVALRKGWECCTLVRRMWGDAAFAEVWEGSVKDGPLLSFRRLLQGIGLADSFAVGAAEWRRQCTAHGLMDEALEATDLAWVAVRRKGLEDATGIDVQATRAIASRMPAGGLREAFQSAIIGDMVVRSTTRHWQGHDGCCPCGLEPESVEHVWWRCPRYQSLRLGSGRCGMVEGSTLQGCQGRLGTSMQHPAMQRWRAELVESVWLKPAWRAPLIFVDASGRHPTDPQARVVGFGICGQVAGEWRREAGWLRAGESVTAAECIAAARGFSLCTRNGIVVTDCQAVFHMARWLRKPKGSAAAKLGKLKHTCWELLAAAVGERPDVQLRWMRSHRSGAEALRLGISEEWRIGNDQADELAKAAARWIDLPEHLMQQHVQHRSRADRVAGTVAEIQLRRLQARTRTEEGGAAKERVRTQPGLPWRLRAKGAKRARPAEVAVRADAAAVQPLAASDLLQMQPGKWPPLASVWSAVQNAGPPAEGLHHLVVPGPWPAPGSGKAVNGRLAGKWVCTGCGRRAGDSSRAVALARTPCGAAVWEARAASHELLELNGVLVCRRCGLQTTAQHASQASRARCPVASLHRGEQPWLEGEAGLRSVLGQICGYRRWCETAAECVGYEIKTNFVPAAAVPRATMGASFPGSIGGMRPFTAAGPPAVTAVAAEVGAAQQGPADVALELVPLDLLRHPPSVACGFLDLHRKVSPVPAVQVEAEPPTKRARPAEGAAALDEMGPLAAAAGPIERMRLKASKGGEQAVGSQAAGGTRAASSSVAVEGLAAIPSSSTLGGVQPAAAPAVPGQSTASGGEPAAKRSRCEDGRLQQCALGSRRVLPLQPVHAQPSAAKKARQAVELPTGPPALSLRPYVCHTALRLGRSGLWCLNCFKKPVGDYRAWLQERCLDVGPPSAMPSSLAAALLRSSEPDANASEATRKRHAVLLSLARVVPVPRAAFPREARQEEGQVEEHQGLGSVRGGSRGA